MRTSAGLVVVAAVALSVPISGPAASSEAGRASASAAPAATTTVDDRALARKGVWRNKTFAGAFAGTLSKSKDKGATLRSAGATTGGGKVVLQFGPGRGKVVVLVGGVRQKTVLTAADTKKLRKVRFSGDGRVTLKVKKPGRGVYVDALELKLPAPPAPAAGQVIVTEWLSNPDLVPESDGEWFELHNVSAGTLTLTGCKVANQAAASVTLPTATIAAGGRYLLARSGNVNNNGGINENATFNFALTTNGSLTLTCSTTNIDNVAWTGEVSGQSTSLDPDHYTAADNDVPANYCSGSVPYGTGGDLGTPGALNSQCP